MVTFVAMPLIAVSVLHTSTVVIGVPSASPLRRRRKPPYRTCGQQRKLILS
jgi:hypothetical protein